MFIAMKQDDAFDRTMQYQIHHLPTSRFGRRFRRHTPIDDPYGEILEPRWRASTSSAHSDHERATAATNVETVECSESSDAETEDPYLPPESVARTSPSGSEGGEDEEDEGPSVRHSEPVSIALQNAVHNWTPPSLNDYQVMLEQIDFDRVLRRGEVASADRRSRRQAMQSRSDLQAQENEAVASNVAARGRGSSSPANFSSSTSTAEHLTPVVRFSMKPRVHHDERDPDESEDAKESSDDEIEAEHDGIKSVRHCTTASSKMTIRFDPPLSGKYILLKLWSPRALGNIDIERISAYGYAGVRFFPRVETR